MKVGSSKFGQFFLGLIASGSFTLLIVGTASADSTTPPSLPVVLGDTDVAAHTSDTMVGQTVTTIVKSSTTIISTVASDNDSVTPTQLDKSVAETKTDIVASPVSSPAAITNPTMPESSLESATTVAPVAAVILAPVTAPVIIEPAVLHRAALTMVSSVSMPVQLASTLLPAALPTPPTAPKTNGLLTALSNDIVGIVVSKTLVALTGALAVLAGSTALLNLFVIILVSLLSLSYARTLRLSGFSTAARSDVSSLSFATPLPADYESFVPIVFFGGVRDQNIPLLMSANAYQKGGE